MLSGVVLAKSEKAARKKVRKHLKTNVLPHESVFMRARKGAKVTIRTTDKQVSTKPPKKQKQKQMTMTPMDGIADEELYVTFAEACAHLFANANFKGQSVDDPEGSKYCIFSETLVNGLLVKYRKARGIVEPVKKIFGFDVDKIPQETLDAISAGIALEISRRSKGATA